MPRNKHCAETVAVWAGREGEQGSGIRRERNRSTVKSKSTSGATPNSLLTESAIEIILRQFSFQCMLYHYIPRLVINICAFWDRFLLSRRKNSFLQCDYNAVCGYYRGNSQRYDNYRSYEHQFIHDQFTSDLVNLDYCM